MSTPARLLSERTVNERVVEILCQYLDAPTAATAVRVASRHWLRIEPEGLVPAQLLGLTQGLTPLLEELLGPERASAAVRQMLESTSR